MAGLNGQEASALWRTTRQIVLGAIILISIVLFALWRIDNPRVERLRMSLADAVLPSLEWTARPIARVTQMAGPLWEEISAQVAAR